MKIEKDPKISIVMVDGLFRESFHSIDFFGTQTLSQEDYELIWVEYYDRVNPKLKEKISKYPNFKIITLNRNRNEEYHSSYCFNKGIIESKGKLLVIPDADVVVEENFLEQVWKEHQDNNQLVMYIYRYNEPEQKHRQEVDLKHLQDVCILTNPSNYGGCLTVRKEWLLAINGYEQHPVFGTGFHANGLDIYTRLKALGLQVMWHPELKLYHPWHSSTLAQNPAYQYQKVVIEYRAKNLITVSYQGIDSNHDSEMPQILLEELENVKAKQALKNVSSKEEQSSRLFFQSNSFFSKIKSWFKQQVLSNLNLLKT
jgi:hypothetical protein